MDSQKVPISPPELSVIIPVLDEAQALPGLLEDLAGQQAVRLEVLVSDGGSADGSPELARSVAARLGLPIIILTGSRGRAPQLNLGAAASTGEYLLFLHADSLFQDPLALRLGLDSLAARLRARPDGRVAGRFGLSFRRSNPDASLAYRFYELKARLDRPGCTHGDQGLLLPRRLFAEVGPFEDGLPMLAETRLAEKVRQCGEWCLLPAQISTLARRFETEGLRERQTLNLLITALAAAGADALILRLDGIYHPREEGKRLSLTPFLSAIDRHLAAMTGEEHRRFWQRVGAFTRDNAWQIPLLLDNWLCFHRGHLSGGEATPFLKTWDRYLSPLVAGRWGGFVASILARCWFRLTLRLAARRESRDSRR